MKFDSGFRCVFWSTEGKKSPHVQVVSFTFYITLRLVSFASSCPFPGGCPQETADGNPNAHFCVICLESLPTWHFLFCVLSLPGVHKARYSILTQYSTTYLHFISLPFVQQQRGSLGRYPLKGRPGFSLEKMLMKMFSKQNCNKCPIFIDGAHTLPQVVLKGSLVFAEDELERSDVSSEPLWVLKPAVESCLIEVCRRRPRFHLLAKTRQKQNANVVEGCTVFLLTRIFFGDRAAFVHFYNFHIQKAFPHSPRTFLSFLLILLL